MLSEIQVKIVFLSLLGREPNPAELQEEIDEVNNTIQALTLKIQSNEEFLELTNTAFGALSFSNDVISLSNIISPFDNGLYIGNNNVSYITSSDYKTVNSPTLLHNNNFIEFNNPFDVRFFSSNDIDNSIGHSNHNQYLDMNTSIFTDTMDIGSNFKLRVDKTCLHTYKNCIIHSYTLSNLDVYESDVDVYHLTELQDIRSFDTNIITLDNMSKYYLSSHMHNNLQITHLYEFGEDTQFTYHGYKQFKTHSQNNFKISCPASSGIKFSVVTCIQDATENPVDNKDILLTLVSQTIDIVVEDHINRWNDIWKRNLKVTYKHFLTQTELQESQKYEIELKLGLFKLYSIGYTDDFMFALPILNIMYPEKVKLLLNNYIDSAENKIPTELFGKNGVYYPPKFQNNAEHFFWNTRYIRSVYKSALVSISIWNYFRVSRDTNWLIMVGYPGMKRIADFLSSCVDSDGNINNVISYNQKQQTNNTFVNFITYLALKYTNSATNELKYATDEVHAASLQRLKPNVFRMVDPSDSIINLVIGDFYKDLFIKVVQYNDTYRYVLYDSLDSVIGGIASGNFGGSSGYKLKIRNDTVFHLDSTVQNYPIIFTGLETKIESGVVYKEPIEIPHNGITFKLSELDQLKTFTGFKYDNQSIHSQLKVNFESYYENDAFIIQGSDDSTTSSTISSDEVKNILKLHDTYSPADEMDHMELFYIFSSTLLNEHVRNDFNELNDLNDIMKDTSLYYETRYDNTGLNGVFTSILEGRQAQFQSSYNFKKNSANKHIKSIINADKISPFGEKLPVETLYSFLMSLCCFEIQGERLSSGFMKNDYKVVSTSKNVFPRPFKHFELTNIGVSKKTQLFNNILYNDTPFDIIDNSAYSVTLNERNSNMTVFIETTEELEPEQRCKLFINGSNVTADYLVDGKSNLFVIPYDVPTSTSEEQIIIDNMSNVRIETTFKSSSSTVVKNFTYLRDNMGTSFINPTIYGDATINTSNNKLSLALTFNTQNEYKYDVLDSFSFSNTFNPRFLSNPQYVPSDVISSSNVSTTSSNIDLSISSPGLAGIVDVGQITFDLNLENLSFVQNSNLPISGNVESFDLKRSAIFYNTADYPPTVYKTKMPPEYVYPTYELVSQNDDIKYVPLTLIYSSGNNSFEQIGHGDDNRTTLRSFQESVEINEFLSNNNLHMKNIYSAANHSILHLSSDETLEDQLYAIGYDHSNNLMATNSYTSNLYQLDIIPCRHFNSFADSNNIDFNRIQSIRTNKLATMIVLDRNDVFAIGYNEQYNLGIVGDNTNKTELTYCSAISNLAHSNNANVVDIHFKDSSTTVHLDNQKVYSIGMNACFNYASSNQTVFLDTFNELELVNRFLYDSNYTILKMDGGENYFRFLLSNSASNSKEWWGFGQNQYGVLGTFFDESVDTDDYMLTHTTNMSRLTEIESLIHGRKFDINYTGPSITNSNHYYLLPHDGISTYHNFLIDTITNDIYINGVTELPSDQEIENNQDEPYSWRIWSSWPTSPPDASYKERFFKFNNHGIFVGFSDSNITYHY